MAQTNNIKLNVRKRCICISHPSLSWFSIRPPSALRSGLLCGLWSPAAGAELEVSSRLLYWCRAPLGAVMHFIPSITWVWRAGNIALRAHTGHRWRSETRRYAEIAEVWENLLITGDFQGQTPSEGPHKDRTQGWPKNDGKEPIFYDA